MSKLNSYGYVGSILTCSECGEVVIICHGEIYKILECTKKGHTVIERKPKEDFFIKNAFKPFFVEREHTKKPTIEKGMTFSDIQRGSQI